MAYRGGIAASVLILLAAGCAANDVAGGPLTAPSGSTEVDPLVAANPGVPEFYQGLPQFLSDEDYELMVPAIQAARKSCMEQNGFQYVEIEEHKIFGPVGFHPLDRSKIERYGFHYLPEEEWTNPNDQFLSVPGWEVAMDGVTDHSGCSEVARQLSRTPAATAYLEASDALDVQLNELVSQTATDPEVLAANAAFDQCLKDVGFASQEDWASTGADFAEQPEVTKEEVRIRMMGYDCDVDSNRTVTVHAKIRAAFETFTESNAAKLNDIVAMKDEYIEERIAAAEAIRAGTLKVPATYDPNDDWLADGP